MDWIEVGFRLRRPWITRFEINGREYGGATSFRHDSRIAAFRRFFPPADVESVLDLGSLEGGQTFQLATSYRAVTAVEVRRGNLRRAQFVQRLVGADNVRFVCANLERSIADLGTFDAVLCSGLLYHLPRPWQLLRELPALAPRLLLWTHYADEVETTESDCLGRWVEELRPRWNLTSGVSARSFWLGFSSLIDLLREGYSSVEVVADDPAHINGAAVTIAAWR